VSFTVAGVSWLAFGGYTNYGEDVWGRRLNYYLIPVLVSSGGSAQSQNVSSVI